MLLFNIRQRKRVQTPLPSPTKHDKAAEDMFQLYANLLSVDARYMWNKIVQKQTNADPYTDL
jgi:hypothetical protein